MRIVDSVLQHKFWWRSRLGWWQWWQQWAPSCWCCFSSHVVIIAFYSLVVSGLLCHCDWCVTGWVSCEAKVSHPFVFSCFNSIKALYPPFCCCFLLSCFCFTLVITDVVSPLSNFMLSNPSAFTRNSIVSDLWFTGLLGFIDRNFSSIVEELSKEPCVCFDC